MNPPYTRQERLPAGRKEAAGVLGRRAGLHAHFLVRLAECIRPGGWIGAITSATWLAADFGRGLRAFLLQRFRIHHLITFDADVFPDAVVEACVVILEKRPGPDEAALRAETPVRFIRLNAGSDLCRAARDAAGREGSGSGPGYRLRVVAQGELRTESRWDHFFTAPDCHARVADAPGLVPLAALAAIRRGITTGDNRAFLPDGAAIARWGIEGRHLRPFLRSPREIPGLDTAGVARPGVLLLPPGEEEGETRAAAYLRAQGVSGSAYLPRELPASAPLLFGYAVRARKAFFLNGARLLAGDNFFCLTPRRAEDLPVLFALLNAAPAALLLELQGRAQGRGLLKIQRYELAGLRVADPSGLDAGLRRDLASLGEALRAEPSSEDVRAALDEAAARALGLDAGEIRRAERELAEARNARRPL
ncbi:MAG: Eco57I restriction-modification methylase domain-containing protein [Armatimonadetes bacterium]|nr:Eco57I restriction-modification methylase domain-containing protein [Armatimonadota bacterium]